MAWFQSAFAAQIYITAFTSADEIDIYHSLFIALSALNSFPSIMKCHVLTSTEGNTIPAKSLLAILTSSTTLRCTTESLFTFLARSFSVRSAIPAHGVFAAFIRTFIVY
mmetsp:Transcript_9836/g.16698  ORF Transcript_9836/g.16698 Transcript_9836/m.16698 type:complete len:109 (+) Transcript_9836:553-879(+)